MKKYPYLFYYAVGLLILAGIVCLLPVPAVQAGQPAQIPTGSIPTVTGTPSGTMARIIGDGQADQLNIRSGPGTTGYEIIGVLIVGQQVPALGISPGGDWVQIAYPGVPGGKAWLYRPYVELTNGEPPIVEPPPTPTPRVTPTIDPTLAAQFVVEAPPTRLPTFTAPAPIILPTYASDMGEAVTSRVPMGMVIIALAVVGLFGTLISFLGGR